MVPVTAVLLLFFFEPTRVPIYPVCVFHRVTGLDCPACGSLRAMHQLLHGNIISAMGFNAFTVLSLPLAAGLWIRWQLRQNRGEQGIGIRPIWFWIYLAAFVTFGILRELPVPVFAAFAP